MTLDASSGSSETAERLKAHNERKVREREARFARGWERGRSGTKPTDRDVDSARADFSVGLVSLVTGTTCVADVGAFLEKCLKTGREILGGAQTEGGLFFSHDFLTSVLPRSNGNPHVRSNATRCSKRC
jgi:hypothetical protein